MFRKIMILAFVVFAAFAFTSCGKPATPAASDIAIGVESQSALDRIATLPDYEFDSVIEEEYQEDSDIYYLTVSGDKKDFDNYVKKCRRAGFDTQINSADETTLYNAVSADGNEIHISFAEDDNIIYISAYRDLNR